MAEISAPVQRAKFDNEYLTNERKRSNMHMFGSKAAGYLWDDARLSPTHPSTRSGFGSETVGYLLSTPAVTHTSEALR